MIDRLPYGNQPVTSVALLWTRLRGTPRPINAWQSDDGFRRGRLPIRFPGR